MENLYIQFRNSLNTIHKEYCLRKYHNYLIMKYIVSFTTSPTRIHKCQPMLNSLLQQSRKPDLIILNIPYVFARTGEEYTIPTHVSQYVCVNQIEIDYGPGTKIIPTIHFLKDKGYESNDTRIIYLDDDIQYPINMIQTYEKIIKENDNSVWTATGFNFLDLKLFGERRHKMQATIAEGYGGVCVKMNTFHDDFYSYINKYITDVDCRLSDDIILSNYYHKQKIPIKILNIREKYSIIDMWQNKCILEYGNEVDALHNGANGTSETNVKRYNKVIRKLGKEKERFFKVYFTNKGKIQMY